MYLALPYIFIIVIQFLVRAMYFQFTQQKRKGLKIRQALQMQDLFYY